MDMQISTFDNQTAVIDTRYDSIMKGIACW